MNMLKIGMSSLLAFSFGNYVYRKNTSENFFGYKKRKALNVCVTGAAGQIGYSLLPLLASGEAFGEKVDLDLRLMDIPQAETLLKAVEMQIKDGAFPNIASIKTGSDPNQLFQDADVVIFLGGMPRQPGMERKDLLKVNGDIFIAQGHALDKVAKKDVQSIIVANPANTNALILSNNAPSINKKNFTVLSRLDHNRALSQLADKAGVKIDKIKNVVVWGNHSTTQYPDVNHGTIDGQKIKDVIQDQDYFQRDFIQRIQKRGAEILNTRQNSAVSSAAVAVVDHLRDWYKGTPNDTFVSMGVYSDGTAYEIPQGIFYSMPVQCKNFDYEIVRNLQIDDFSQNQMKITADELLSEKQDFYSK